MRAINRTYALPAELVTQFEASVSPERRSSVMAAILQDWMAEQGRKELEAGVVEGCREMADTYLEIEREFHPLEEEVDRGSNGVPPAR